MFYIKYLKGKTESSAMPATLATNLINGDNILQSISTQSKHELFNASD